MTQSKRAKTSRDINSMPDNMKCPCGGGQSCIIDRRWIGDWVHEDNVFNKNNLPLRKSCFQPYTIEQDKALFNELNPLQTYPQQNSFRDIEQFNLFSESTNIIDGNNNKL
tara:strand:- start:2006 stop:2335 length:330 start_codon:yes stop_codon:yes gene_type:complete